MDYMEAYYAVAEQLGLEAFFDMSGDDGTVLFLEDGRMLKITGKKEEALVAQCLMEKKHNSFPRVHGLWKWDMEYDMSEFSVPNRVVEKYVVLRDSFDDIFEYEEYRVDIDKFCSWWRDSGDLNLLSDVADEVRKMAEALVWMRDSNGITIMDVRPRNIGESGGFIGVRDWGRSILAHGLIEAFELSEIPMVPQKNSDLARVL